MLHEAKSIPYEGSRPDLEDVMPELDILYMTRVQKERFFNEEDYVRLKDFYILNKAENGTGKAGHVSCFIPFHVSTRSQWRSTDDPRAAYFKQVQYGVYVRMALIHDITGR